MSEKGQKPQKVKTCVAATLILVNEFLGSLSRTITEEITRVDYGQIWVKFRKTQDFKKSAIFLHNITLITHLVLQYYTCRSPKHTTPWVSQYQMHCCHE